MPFHNFVRFLTPFILDITRQLVIWDGHDLLTKVINQLMGDHHLVNVSFIRFTCVAIAKVPATVNVISENVI